MERVASVVSDLEQRLKGVDPDLYDPDRYEVAVGLTTRIVRIAQSGAAEPSLWRPEASHALLRAAVESRIALEWLAKQDDSSIFTTYKDYGRGHLKLYKLHLEDHMATMTQE